MVVNSCRPVVMCWMRYNFEHMFRQGSTLLVPVKIETVSSLRFYEFFSQRGNIKILL